MPEIISLSGDSQRVPASAWIALCLALLLLASLAGNALAYLKLASTVPAKPRPLVGLLSVLASVMLLFGAVASAYHLRFFDSTKPQPKSQQVQVSYPDARDHGLPADEASKVKAALALETKVFTLLITDPRSRRAWGQENGHDYWARHGVWMTAAWLKELALLKLSTRALYEEFVRVAERFEVPFEPEGWLEEVECLADEEFYRRGEGVFIPSVDPSVAAFVSSAPELEQFYAGPGALRELEPTCLQHPAGDPWSVDLDKVTALLNSGQRLEPTALEVPFLEAYCKERLGGLLEERVSLLAVRKQRRDSLRSYVLKAYGTRSKALAALRARRRALKEQVLSYHAARALDLAIPKLEPFAPVGIEPALAGQEAAYLLGSSSRFLDQEPSGTFPLSDLAAPRPFQDREPAATLGASLLLSPCEEEDEDAWPAPVNYAPGAWYAAARGLSTSLPAMFLPSPLEDEERFEIPEPSASIDWDEVTFTSDEAELPHEFALGEYDPSGLIVAPNAVEWGLEPEQLEARHLVPESLLSVELPAIEAVGRLLATGRLESEPSDENTLAATLPEDQSAPSSALLHSSHEDPEVLILEEIQQELVALKAKGQDVFAQIRASYLEFLLGQEVQREPWRLLPSVVLVGIKASRWAQVLTPNKQKALSYKLARWILELATVKGYPTSPANLAESAGRERLALLIAQSLGAVGFNKELKGVMREAVMIACLKEPLFFAEITIYLPVEAESYNAELNQVEPGPDEPTGSSVDIGA